jgi:hypothetical protein
MPATSEFAARFLCCGFRFLPCEKNLGLTVEHPFLRFSWGGTNFLYLKPRRILKGGFSEPNKITAVDTELYIHPTFMPNCVFFKSVLYERKELEKMY